MVMSLASHRQEWAIRQAGAEPGIFHVLGYDINTQIIF